MDTDVAERSLVFSELKPEQKRAIDAFVSGRDVFVCLSTGFGKSVCFIVLPILFDITRKCSDSVIVVVSPLKSLMADQVDSCS